MPSDATGGADLEPDGSAARGSTLDQLASLIVRHLGKDTGPITRETSLRDGLGIDSLDLVDLVVAVEDQFQVLIPDGAAERFETVGDLAGFLDSVRPDAPAGHGPTAG